MTGTDVLFCLFFLHLYLSFIRSKETYLSAVLCKLVILTQQDVMSHEHIFWEKKVAVQFQLNGYLTQL